MVKAVDGIRETLPAHRRDIAAIGPMEALLFQQIETALANGASLDDTFLAARLLSGGCDMPRLMSVSLTEQAVVERRKTVTRRKGWLFLKPGDRLTLCRKVQGRRPGEPLVRLAEVQVVSVRRERLNVLRESKNRSGELAREGFTDIDADEFMRRYFVEAQGIGPHDFVTRIEWRYLDDELQPQGDPAAPEGGQA